MDDRDTAAQRKPDYRFTLANERTYLAYVRTALALDAAGLAATQFLRPSAIHLRLAIGLVLIGLGFALAILGYHRWRASDRALREDRPLPQFRLPIAMSIGLIAISLTALALVISTR